MDYAARNALVNHENGLRGGAVEADALRGFVGGCRAGSIFACGCVRAIGGGGDVNRAVLDALDHGLRQRNFTGGGFSGDAVGGFFGDIYGDAAAIFQDDGVGAGSRHRAGQHETEREERHV